MMVDSSAFINDSLNPGLKHLKSEETSGKIRSFTECFVSVPFSWGQAELLLFPWLLWVVLPAQFTKC